MRLVDPGVESSGKKSDRIQSVAYEKKKLALDRQRAKYFPWFVVRRLNGWPVEFPAKQPHCLGKRAVVVLPANRRRGLKAWSVRI